MNWIEREFYAVAEIYNQDVWILAEALTFRCEHRWRARNNPVHPMARGFYRLDVITVCTRCGAEA